ncbi:hypothetical protein Hanom_Chr03g00181051 [Helianthus anomalus]
MLNNLNPQTSTQSKYLKRPNVRILQTTKYLSNLRQPPFILTKINRITTLKIHLH